MADEEGRAEGTTWEAVDQWLKGGAPDDRPPPALEFLPADYLREHPRTPRPTAIVGILRVGDLAIISGSFDTFKSTFALEMVHSLTSGDPFLGRFRVNQRLRMGLLQSEIDPGSYDERLETVGAGSDLVVCSDMTFTFDKLAGLARAVDDYQLDGFVLDPIGDMWPTFARGGEAFSENLKTHVGPLLRALKLFRKTIILVHHDPKASQGVRNRASGSSALLNAPDTRIFLDRNDPLVSVSVRSRLQSPIGQFDMQFRSRRLRFSTFD